MNIQLLRIFVRHNHTSQLWLKTFSGLQVPRHLFDISYSRSSGPGGQKVNKTSSKATITLPSALWLDPSVCYWIPGPVREQLREKKIRYETKSGGVVVQSDASRNRDVNADNCFEKLVEEIKSKVVFEAEPSEEDKKKWQEIKTVTNEKRLLDKKRQSEKKKLRSKSFDW